MTALVVQEPEMAEDPAPPAAYTIDELAAHTGVPSRTIRYYQAKGALPAPEKRGRIGVYSDLHVSRLALIGTLQDRGLQIKAIRDLLHRVDRGEVAIDDWLGLHDRISTGWVAEAPRVLTADELAEATGDARPGVAAELVAAGLLERRGDQWLAPRPDLLRTALELRAAGIDVDVTGAALELTRKHVRKLVGDVVQHYVRHAGDGFGDGASGLEAAFHSARPGTVALVRAVLEEELDAALQELAASGKLTAVAARKR